VLRGNVFDARRQLEVSAMKHIVHLVCILPPLVGSTDIAEAFVHSVPPLSGPGSVFHGNEVTPEQKSCRHLKSYNPDTKTFIGRDGKRDSCAP